MPTIVRDARALPIAALARIHHVHCDHGRARNWISQMRGRPAELIRGGRNFLASGYRGITVVPMLRGDTAIGAISIVRPNLAPAH